MKSYRGNKNYKFFSVLLTTITIMAIAGGADEIKATKEIINNWQDAIVPVRMVIKQGMAAGGREVTKHENVSEAIATVIDPSGLAVLSLTNTDPSALYKHFMPYGEGMPEFSWQTELEDIKMIMPDGKELPAEIVLRDRDLDLAFIRPVEEQAKEFDFVDLTQDSTPDLMLQVVVLTRLGKVAGRVPMVSLCRIEAVIEKPRTFYVVSRGGMESGLGAPVFMLDGKVVGILLLRVMRTRGAGFSDMLSGIGGGILPVVLPASEIVEVAKQVPERE